LKNPEISRRRIEMKTKSKLNKKMLFYGGIFLIPVAFSFAISFLIGGKDADIAEVNFENLPPREQAVKLIEFYHTINLTPEQEEMKYRALSSIPAPCCSDFSIATCCCPCNLAKSVWGLSHHLIVKKGYNIQQVKEEVEEWVQTSNASGYTGKACYNGRCNHSFEGDGCGGMNEKQIL
jgi:hypothetical protein